MKPQRDLAAWISKEGSFDLPCPSPQVKGFVVTDGASVFLEVDRKPFLVASGRGAFTVDLVVNAPCVLFINADKKEHWTSVHLLGWGPGEQVAGFLETPSFVQLDAKARNAIPPEVQAMFDMMQRNALARETALRIELEKSRRNSSL